MPLEDFLDNLQAILPSLALQAPALLVALIGALVAPFLRRHARKAVPLVFCGCVLLLADGLVSAYFYGSGPKIVGEYHLTMEQFTGVLTVFNLAAGAVHAVALILLLCAAFAGRRPADMRDMTEGLYGQA